MSLVGIDGCRTGWVVASSDADLVNVEYTLVGSDMVRDVFLQAVDEGGTVAIDIPIGLADSEPRACDLAARAFLKPPRASSVFPAPCRGTLQAATYAEANRLNREASGRGLPIQAFHLLPKIRGVDDAISPELQNSVRECHPEVVFARLSGENRGLESSKRTVEGRRLRHLLLARRLPLFDERELVSRLGGGSKLATDDLLDALACLVAAQDIVHGGAHLFPGDRVERDRRGLRMEIVG